MNLSAVDRTIRALCIDANSGARNVEDWRLRTEEELLFEACVCMFSSQMVFEVAEGAANHIKRLGLLHTNDLACYKSRVSAALSSPVPVERDGAVRLARPRFKNRLATLLTTTVNDNAFEWADAGGDAIFRYLSA